MRRVILNFHGIGKPERELEPGEADYWVTQSFFTECVNLAKAMSDRISASFTFDDGNASDIEIAAPVLESNDFSGLFFPLAGRLDQPGSLTTGDLRNLTSKGHRIGSHGMDHCDWTRLDEAGKVREWREARDRLSEVAQRAVLDAAIPFGRYDKGVLHGLREAGYERSYSSDGGAWREDDWPIPRTSPRADMTLVDIENTLLGRESALKSVRRTLARAVKARR